MTPNHPQEIPLICEDCGRMETAPYAAGDACICGGTFLNNEVHVLPVADIVTHEETTDCPCGPTIQERDDGRIVVHHSLDGREKREK